MYRPPNLYSRYINRFMLYIDNNVNVISLSQLSKFFINYNEVLTQKLYR